MESEGGVAGEGHFRGRSVVELIAMTLPRNASDLSLLTVTVEDFRRAENPNNFAHLEYGYQTRQGPADAAYPGRDGV